MSAFSPLGDPTELWILWRQWQPDESCQGCHKFFYALETSHLWGSRYSLLTVIVVSFEAIDSLKSEVHHTTFATKSEPIKVQHLAKAVSLSQVLGLAGPLNTVVFSSRTPLSVLVDSMNHK